MPLFQRLMGNHPSPLLPSVPLDGTQTVVGLRELERRARLRPLLQPHAEAHAQGAAYCSRYQGPHVWELPLDALKAAPVQWHCFMHGGRLAQAYSVPASTTMLLDRLDENIATYLGNYLYMAWVLLAIAGYMNPKAALGVFALALMVAANVALRQANISGQNAEMAASGLGVAILILICWTRCLAVLARWVVHVLLAAALHGSLRVTRTEAAAAVPRGVTFRQVLGFDRAHPDPRRVFRELWQITWGAACDAAGIAGAWCQRQVHQTLGQSRWRWRAPVPEAYVH